MLNKKLIKIVLLILITSLLFIGCEKESNNNTTQSSNSNDTTLSTSVYIETPSGNVEINSNDNYQVITNEEQITLQDTNSEISSTDTISSEPILENTSINVPIKNEEQTTSTPDIVSNTPNVTAEQTAPKTEVIDNTTPVSGELTTLENELYKWVSNGTTNNINTASSNCVYKSATFYYSCKNVCDNWNSDSAVVSSLSKQEYDYTFNYCEYKECLININAATFTFTGYGVDAYTFIQAVTSAGKEDKAHDFVYLKAYYDSSSNKTIIKYAYSDVTHINLG